MLRQDCDSGGNPGVCFVQGMTSYLYANDIRIFDYPQFAEPLNDMIRENAERMAKGNGLQIEFIRKMSSLLSIPCDNIL